MKNEMTSEQRQQKTEAMLNAVTDRWAPFTHEPRSHSWARALLNLAAYEADCERVRNGEPPIRTDYPIPLPNIETNRTEAISIDEIPTPETDAAWNLYHDDHLSEDGDPWGLASKLERRLTIERNRAEEMGELAYTNACEAMKYCRLLTIAREALKRLDNWLMRDAQRKQIIAQALTQTAPKP